jgi:hypothetical protein
MYRSPHLRVSDADREAIVAQLNTATAEGRLTIEEFSERSRQAYASRTWGELSTVVADLPAPVVAYQKTHLPPPAETGGRTPLLAMILGILSLPLIPCLGTPLGGLIGIAAVVLGVSALNGPAHRVPNGRAMAITGVTCGALGILAQIAMFAEFVL